MRSPLYTVHGLPTGQVSVMARPRGGDWLLDEIKALHESGVDTLVSLLTLPEINEFELTDEALFCHDQSINYLSFPIPDYSVPAFSATTFAFLDQLHHSVFEGKHVALHCRQGLGRAVLMAASLLVLAGFSPEQACAELSRVRGHSVPETDEQQAWLVTFFQYYQKSKKA
jgi:protein-tyrosine phosphatase